MAAKKKEEKQPQQDQTLPGPTYPVIEKFIETATADVIGNTFKALRDDLSGLKGPKAEQAKKVGKAVERTEELLSYLLQVREKLEADRKGKGGARK
ncbi:MAG: hypothetical protein JNM17_37715 [Archangium sp.]|nr:hypothetical protein [Archangium sp.]